MNIENKLKGFLKVAMAEADEKKQALESQIKAEYDKAVEAAGKNAERQANEKVRLEAVKAEQEKNHAIIEAKSQIKRKFLRLKNELTDQLFTEITSKLEAFVKSESYEQYLLDGIKKTVDKYENISIILSEADMKHAERIKKELNVEVASSNEDFLGGFKAVLIGKNAIVDNTFRTKLEDEKESFVLEAK